MLPTTRFTFARNDVAQKMLEHSYQLKLSVVRGVPDAFNSLVYELHGEFTKGDPIRLAQELLTAFGSLPAKNAVDKFREDDDADDDHASC
jgi:hypothetical protein